MFIGFCYEEISPRHGRGRGEQNHRLRIKPKTSLEEREIVKVTGELISRKREEIERSRSPGMNLVCSRDKSSGCPEQRMCVG